jgi:hypothetical protein
MRADSDPTSVEHPAAADQQHQKDDHDQSGGIHVCLLSCVKNGGVAAARANAIGGHHRECADHTAG